MKMEEDESGNKLVYEVHVLKEGYSFRGADGHHRADGSITLLQHKLNLQHVIVDLGSPCDRQCVLEGLMKHGLTPQDIMYVVCTHGHSDHVGNLNLFPHATCIVGFDISQQDKYIEHAFKDNKPYHINDDVIVIATPGHDASHVSVIVRNVKDFGTVLVAGDLFECAGDIADPTLWSCSSQDVGRQVESRYYAPQFLRTLSGQGGGGPPVRHVGHIIPGHGPMFTLTKEMQYTLGMSMKERQMQRVERLEQLRAEKGGQLAQQTQQGKIIRGMLKDADSKIQALKDADSKIQALKEMKEGGGNVGEEVVGDKGSVEGEGERDKESEG